MLEVPSENRENVNLYFYMIYLDARSPAPRTAATARPRAAETDVSAVRCGPGPSHLCGPRKRAVARFCGAQWGPGARRPGPAGARAPGPAPVGARCPTEDVHLNVAPPTHVAVRETPFCIRIFPSELALRAASARSFRHLLTCSYTQTCRFPHHTPSSALEFIGPQRALAKRT